MDALALLCTLHADGPSTLHDLRAAGCQNLLDLTQCTSAELAQYLELSVASAERLQREAELLDARLDNLEPEESRVPSKVDFGLRGAPENSAEEIAAAQALPAVEEPVEEEAEIEPVLEDVEVVEVVEEAVEAKAEERSIVVPRIVRSLPPSMASPRSHRAWFSATRIPKQTLTPERDLPPMEELVLPAMAVAEAPPIKWQAARIAIEELARAQGEFDDAMMHVGAREESEENSVEVEIPPMELVPHKNLATELAVTSEEPAAETIRVEPVSVLGNADRSATRALAPHRDLLDAAAQRSKLPSPQIQPIDERVSVSGEEQPAAVQPAAVQPAAGQPRENHASETALRMGEPEGLDEELLKALHSAGILTAEALVEASGLELSRKIAVPFTRLLELQLGAQHLFRRNTLVPRSPAAKSSRTARAPYVPTKSTTRMRRHTDSSSLASTPKSQGIEMPESIAPHTKDNVGGPFA